MNEFEEEHDTSQAILEVYRLDNFNRVIMEDIIKLYYLVTQEDEIVQSELNALIKAFIQYLINNVISTSIVDIEKLSEYITACLNYNYYYIRFKIINMHEIENLIYTIIKKIEDLLDNYLPVYRNYTFVDLIICQEEDPLLVVDYICSEDDIQ